MRREPARGFGGLTSVFLAWLLWFAASGSARAQSGRGGFASVEGSAAAIEEGTRASFTAGIGYRVTPAVGISMELTFVPTIQPELPSIVPLTTSSVAGVPVPVPTLSFAANGGRATIFTTDLRLDVPTGSSRNVPFLVGGAGVGSVTDRWRETIGYPIAIPTVVIPTSTESFSRTTNGFAVTLGGGVSVRLGRHFSLDGDLRYIGVLGDRDLRIGRFGGGMTYQF